MCIRDLDEDNPRDLSQVNPAIRLPWHGIMVRLEDQALGVLEIYGELAFAIAFELVAASGPQSHLIGQVPETTQFIQPLD